MRHGTHYLIGSGPDAEVERRLHRSECGVELRQGEEAVRSERLGGAGLTADVGGGPAEVERTDEDTTGVAGLRVRDASRPGAAGGGLDGRSRTADRFEREMQANVDTMMRALVGRG